MSWYAHSSEHWLIYGLIMLAVVAITVVVVIN
jgi:hypothetical protein